MTKQRQTVFVGNPSERQPSSKVFRHIVLLMMYGGTPKTPEEHKALEATVDEALRLMVAMCEDDTVLHYEVGVSEDTRKGVILFEFVDYADKDAFEAFKATEGHETFAAFARDNADWIIADYFVAV